MLKRFLTSVTTAIMLFTLVSLSALMEAGRYRQMARKNGVGGP